MENNSLSSSGLNSDDLQAQGCSDSPRWYRGKGGDQQAQIALPHFLMSRAGGSMMERRI